MMYSFEICGWICLCHFLKGAQDGRERSGLRNSAVSEVEFYQPILFTSLSRVAVSQVKEKIYSLDACVLCFVLLIVSQRKWGVGYYAQEM